MAKKRAPSMTTAHQAMRRKLRKHLHAQLDALLNGKTTEEDGTELLVMDSMTMRALAGYGFNVRVHSLHPDQTVKQEAPQTVDAGPAVGLVRDGG